MDTFERDWAERTGASFFESTSFPYSIPSLTKDDLRFSGITPIRALNEKASKFIKSTSNDTSKGSNNKTSGDNRRENKNPMASTAQRSTKNQHRKDKNTDSLVFKISDMPDFSTQNFDDTETSGLDGLAEQVKYLLNKSPDKEEQNKRTIDKTKNKSRESILSTVNNGNRESVLSRPEVPRMCATKDSNFDGFKDSQMSVPKFQVSNLDLIDDVFRTNRSMLEFLKSNHAKIPHSDSSSSLSSVDDTLIDPINRTSAFPAISFSTFLLSNTHRKANKDSLDSVNKDSLDSGDSLNDTPQQKSQILDESLSIVEQKLAEIRGIKERIRAQNEEDLDSTDSVTIFNEHSVETVKTNKDSSKNSSKDSSKNSAKNSLNNKTRSIDSNNNPSISTSTSGPKAISTSGSKALSNSKSGSKSISTSASMDSSLGSAFASRDSTSGKASSKVRSSTKIENLLNSSDSIEYIPISPLKKSNNSQQIESILKDILQEELSNGKKSDSKSEKRKSESNLLFNKADNSPKPRTSSSSSALLNKRSPESKSSKPVLRTLIERLPDSPSSSSGIRSSLSNDRQSNHSSAKTARSITAKAAQLSNSSSLPKSAQLSGQKVHETQSSRRPTSKSSLLNHKPYTKPAFTSPTTAKVQDIIEATTGKLEELRLERTENDHFNGQPNDDSIMDSARRFEHRKVQEERRKSDEREQESDHSSMLLQPNRSIVEQRADFLNQLEMNENCIKHVQRELLLFEKLYKKLGKEKKRVKFEDDGHISFESRSGWQFTVDETRPKQFYGESVHHSGEQTSSTPDLMTMQKMDRMSKSSNVEMKKRKKFTREEIENARIEHQKAKLERRNRQHSDSSELELSADFLSLDEPKNGAEFHSLVSGEEWTDWRRLGEENGRILYKENNRVQFRKVNDEDRRISAKEPETHRRKSAQDVQRSKEAEMRERKNAKEVETLERKGAQKEQQSKRSGTKGRHDDRREGEEYVRRQERVYERAVNNESEENEGEDEEVNINGHVEKGNSDGLRSRSGHCYCCPNNDKRKRRSHCVKTSIPASQSHSSSAHSSSLSHNISSSTTLSPSQSSTLSGTGSITLSQCHHQHSGGISQPSAGAAPLRGNTKSAPKSVDYRSRNTAVTTNANNPVDDCHNGAQLQSRARGGSTMTISNADNFDHKDPRHRDFDTKNKKNTNNHHKETQNLDRKAERRSMKDDRSLEEGELESTIDADFDDERDTSTRLSSAAYVANVNRSVQTSIMIDNTPRLRTPPVNSSSLFSGNADPFFDLNARKKDDMNTANRRPIVYFLPLDSVPTKSPPRTNTREILRHSMIQVPVRSSVLPAPELTIQEAFTRRCGAFRQRSAARVNRIVASAERRIETADQRKRAIAQSYATKKAEEERQRLSSASRPIVQRSIPFVAGRRGAPEGRGLTHREMRAQTEKIYRRLPEARQADKWAKKEDEARRRRVMADIFKQRLKANAIKGKLNWPITTLAITAL